MKTLVIVINWNGEREFIECLASLRSTYQAGTSDVLILDNASTRGALAQARSEFPEFHFLVLKENQYWAGGNNRGIEWALERGYDWIVLSNSDIIVDERWAVALHDVSTDIEIGALGFKVFGESQRVPIQEFENYRASYRIENLEWVDDEFISGCFLAVRAECFRKLGGFDEVYKMYSEEHDFLFRMRLAGWKTVRCNSPIWHLSEAASRKTPIKTSYFAIRNELRYIIKFEDFAFYRILRRTARFTMDMLNLWKKVDEIDCCQRRKKPTMNPFVNLWILYKAFFWNFINYFQTREIGRRDMQFAISVKSKSLINS